MPAEPAPDRVCRLPGGLPRAQPIRARARARSPLPEPRSRATAGSCRSRRAPTLVRSSERSGLPTIAHAPALIAQVPRVQVSADPSMRSGRIMRDAHGATRTAGCMFCESCRPVAFVVNVAFTHNALTWSASDATSAHEPATPPVRLRVFGFSPRPTLPLDPEPPSRKLGVFLVGHVEACSDALPVITAIGFCQAFLSLRLIPYPSGLARRAHWRPRRARHRPGAGRRQAETGRPAGAGRLRGQ